MTNTVEIIESKAIREELISHLEVLEKVGTLIMLPKTEYVATKYVASYYEVDIETIKKIVQRHRSELISDGMLSLKGNETKNFLMKSNLDTQNNDGDIVYLSSCPGGFIYEDIHFSN